MRRRRPGWDHREAASRAAYLPSQSLRSRNECLQRSEVVGVVDHDDASPKDVGRRDRTSLQFLLQDLNELIAVGLTTASYPGSQFEVFHPAT